MSKLGVCLGRRGMEREKEVLTKLKGPQVAKLRTFEYSSKVLSLFRNNLNPYHLSLITDFFHNYLGLDLDKQNWLSSGSVSFMS